MEQCERCGGLLLTGHICNEAEVELGKAMKEHLVKVNTVWVVEYYIPYEGSDMCAIFSTHEKAKAYILKKDPDWDPSKKRQHYILYSMLIDDEDPERTWL